MLTENIIQITNTTNVSTYTFDIDTNFETTGYLENLHLVETGQDYIAYIIRYIPDATWSTNSNNYTPEGDLVLDVTTFQGDKTKYTLDREVVWSTIPPDNTRGSFVEVCSFSLVQYCTNDGGGGSDGDPHIRTSKCNGPFFFDSNEGCSTVYASGGFGDSFPDESDGSNETTNGGGYDYNDGCKEVTGTLIQNSQPISSLSTGCTTNNTTGVAFGNLDCLLNMPSSAINELTTFFGAGNYQIDCDLDLNSLPYFSSAQDANDFIEGLIDNVSSQNSTSISEEGSIRRDFHPFEISSFPEARIISAVKLMVPEDNNDLECLQVITVNSYLEGNESLFSWEQLDDSDPNDPDGIVVEIDEAYDQIKISVLGRLKIGVNINGYPVKGVKLSKITLVYQYSTSEYLSNLSYLYNIN
ncbi:hypothetical protein [Olleya namhaensis]|uniref:hypothetical protein n=2 Tax=Olleya TaxID=336276 RepID=UPI0024902ABE|nr:hypothetical protein [Olleya namhaensis]